MPSLDECDGLKTRVTKCCPMHEPHVVLERGYYRASQKNRDSDLKKTTAINMYDLL